MFLIRSGCDVESPRRLGPSGEGAEVANEKHSPLHLCCTWGLTDVIQVYHHCVYSTSKVFLRDNINNS